jgi:hypothetical protein
MPNEVKFLAGMFVCLLAMLISAFKGAGDSNWDGYFHFLLGGISAFTFADAWRRLTGAKDAR